jgi:hypothetical protein
MKNSRFVTGSIFACTLAGLLLALTGCVSSSIPPMPADWPAAHALVRVSDLDGVYRGDHTEVARFNQVFFPKQLMSIQGLDAYRLTTMPAGLQVEALAGGTVLATRVIPVELEAGAVIFEHKDSDAQGSYRARTTAQVNALGELVVAYHRASTSFLGGSTTDWMRLPRAPQ